MRARGREERWNARPTKSFFIPLALRATDLLRAPLSAIGVDYPRFRILLEWFAKYLHPAA